MEIKDTNLQNAYNEADESGKKMLRNMFPDFDFKNKDERPVTERIKTFADALNALGEDNKFVKEFGCIIDLAANTGERATSDLEAYLRLRIIVAALNEGWEPQFTEGEYRYYPWFWLYTQDEIDNMTEEQVAEVIPLSNNPTFAGFAYSYTCYAPSYAYSSIGSRLCFKTRELALYAGKQFAEIWFDYCYCLTQEE